MARGAGAGQARVAYRSRKITRSLVRRTPHLTGQSSRVTLCISQARVLPKMCFTGHQCTISVHIQGLRPPVDSWVIRGSSASSGTLSGVRWPPRSGNRRPYRRLHTSHQFQVTSHTSVHGTLLQPCLLGFIQTCLRYPSAKAIHRVRPGKVVIFAGGVSCAAGDGEK